MLFLKSVAEEFFHQKSRAGLDLGIDLAHILTGNAETNKLNSAKQPHKADGKQPGCHRNAAQRNNELGNQPESRQHGKENAERGYEL